MTVRKAPAAAATLLSALMLASCGADPDYVGKVGVLQDGSGTLQIFVNTCGYDVDEVSVEVGSAPVADYTTEQADSGVFTFTLGDPPPESWSVSGSAPVTDLSAEDTVEVTVSLNAAPSDTEHRRAEANGETLRLEQDRIVVGTPHKSGDQTLSSPEDWAGLCEQDQP
ncbi:hypothetical protein [Corynebacterium variabile]|uniref:hypothetical protein n=1 Tax=Corynebacterium variabile TaxID=1727 RepID=UPI00289CEF51|nr:hypothetical protein [Corynebacterium variabile]